MKPDLEALRRAIEGGCAEAARDAGLEYFALRVDITPLPRNAASIEVEVLELSPEEVARLRELQERAGRRLD